MINKQMPQQHYENIRIILYSVLIGALPLLLVFTAGQTVQAAQVANDIDIRSTLEQTATELKWTGKVDLTPLGTGNTLFIVHDTQGVLAITRYYSPEAAIDSFVSNRQGMDASFHGYPAKSRPGDKSLTWQVNSLVFTVVSKAGTATQWAEIMNNSAVLNSLVKRSTADSNQISIFDFTYMPKAPVEGEPIVLVNMCTNPSGEIVAYLWYVDGNHISESDNQMSVELVGLLAGVHTVELKVRKASGDGSIGKMIKVY